MRILPISRLVFKGSTPVETNTTVMHVKPQPNEDVFVKSDDTKFPSKNGQE